MKHIFRFNTKSLGILALAFLLPLSINPLEAAKPGGCDTDPPHPSCNDDGGDGLPTSDLPANALFWGDVGDAIASDGLYGEVAYIDDQERVSCFIGRREGQFVLSTSNKRTLGRMICLDYTGLEPYSDCGDFSGCRVAEMNTARIEYGGVDLRLMTVGDTSALSLNVYDDRKNLWHIRYEDVSVEPVAWDIDGNPTSWNISCETGYCSDANVRRIVNNQYANPIECGPFSLPFHLTVDLQ